MDYEGWGFQAYKSEDVNEGVSKNRLAYAKSM